MGSVGAWLAAWTRRLEEAGVYAPLEDAQTLLAHALGLEQKEGGVFPLPPDTLLSPEAEAIATKDAQRRQAREPLARILGETSFGGLRFEVSEGVFRPDPQAEAMIEHALLLLEERKGEALRILDLGTGSGCLLLALLSALPQASGVGTDKDPCSLAAAQRNAHRLGLEARALWIASDWGRALEERFDCVIAHPPAVKTSDFSRLDPEMAHYETELSLAGGADGLAAFREIAGDLERLLKPDGFALLRAYTHRREAQLFEGAGFANTEVRRNYKGAPCCLVVRGPCKKKRTKGFWRFLGRV